MSFEEIAEHVIGGNAAKVMELVQGAVDSKEDPQVILQQGLLAGMSVIGEQFKKNEVYVPEVLIAARAMKAGMSIIKPILTSANVKGKGTIVIGTVKGDLHDIGKNLVGMMLEGAGFDVVDAGIDVNAENFLDVAQKNDAQIIGMSALLTTTMPSMKEVIKTLKNSALKDKVMVMIGGAPVTQDYAEEIGADGYAPDAASAADMAKALLGF